MTVQLPVIATASLSGSRGNLVLQSYMVGEYVGEADIFLMVKKKRFLSFVMAR